LIFRRNLHDRTFSQPKSCQIFLNIVVHKITSLQIFIVFLSLILRANS
jgi:hypothetical protein